MPFGKHEITLLKEVFKVPFPALLLWEQGNIMSIKGSDLGNSKFLFECKVKISPVAKVGVEDRRPVLFENLIEERVGQTGNGAVLFLEKSIE
jgi:hypothetical protein